MSQKKLFIVAGTRPEIIKIYSVLNNLTQLGIDHIFIWTGQHYDYEMSRVFFEELKLPEPDHYINIPRRAPIIKKVSTIISELAKYISSDSVVYSLGDTASTLAAAIAANYVGAVFVHDEAGVRSFDLSMLEEINRRLTDQIAWLHLAPSPFSVINLLVESVPCESILPTGSTLVDAFKKIYPIAQKRSEEILTEFNIDRNYILVTIHRRENLNKDRIIKIINIFTKLVKLYNINIIFPVHPHTRNKLIEYNLINTINKYKKIKLIKPLSYIRFLSLLSKASIVITDSGGVQQEAFLAAKPTITLRQNTEWIETVLLGINHVTDIDYKSILNIVNNILTRNINYNNLPPVYGDGQSGRRVAKILSLIVGGTLYNRLKKMRQELSKGTIVPTIKRGAEISRERRRRLVASAFCTYDRERIEPYCIANHLVQLATKNYTDALCYMLVQYRLNNYYDINILKNMLYEIKWSHIDKLIEHELIS